MATSALSIPESFIHNNNLAIEIKTLVSILPNDQDLGEAVRKLINEKKEIKNYTKEFDDTSGETYKK